MARPPRHPGPDEGVVVRAKSEPGWDLVLTPQALAFVGRLVRELRPRLDELLFARTMRRAGLAAGTRLAFLDDTLDVRNGDWTVDPIPKDLERRVVEITGPVDRKMVINALNSGADTYMADFEDSTSPTWRNVVEGQANLIDAVRRTIRYTDPVSKKEYRLADSIATLLVRPRGLHLTERHIEVDGRTVPGALVDFGLFVFHNARVLLERGSGPYFYVPKLESHHEARFWNETFLLAEKLLGIPRGSCKATVLLETLPAAFEMDEILYELREHSAGLNCGRWDYIFSFIKCHRWRPESVLPDRSQITMTQPFLRAYARLAIRTCHKRRAHAIGGMAAQIPIKNDPQASEAALAKVRADKEREVGDGHDGTWVAHPGLVALARECFAAKMSGPNQLHVKRDDVNVTAEDLLELPPGTRTEDGLRLNIRVGVQYLESWLRGVGCVPLYHLMEDAATAEISRAQVWQWREHQASLEDGRRVTPELIEKTAKEEMERYHGGKFDEARELFLHFCLADDLDEFLTLAAYERLEDS
jgi:malate synthase